MEKFLCDLQSIKFTLNHVSVSGADNLDRVLACIQKLDEMIATIKEGEAHAHQDE